MLATQEHWNDRYHNGNTPWDIGRPSTELQQVLGEFAIQPCRMLEVGCGTGTNAVYLARQGFEVHAFDLASLAIERARQRADEAGVKINFMVADALALPETGAPFDFIFDRGTYHVLRIDRLAAYLRVLRRVSAPGGYYLTLAGNANEPSPAGEGPPRVTAQEMVSELSTHFDLVQLREFRFDAVINGNRPFTPLGWSGLWRRKA
jgi:ubiquinone/menaquinone biosynthesis C-methylase UbiE